MCTSVPWWQDGVIYQIYPKSFQDSTGNGHGDLPGIIQRLDYLQTLGVCAIWLTPVYLSPQVDNGYDVADYCAIDPIYGTIADFERLIDQAHCRNIRVIIDMVFNHTSTAHPWFQSALSPDSPWRSFYFWREGHSSAPPNNWRSKFGGPAWHQNAPDEPFYLHLFSEQQADLNWEYPPVRQALKEICHFWADKGVDGMRLDVINLIAKHPDFPDDNSGDGRRFYTDGARVHDFLREMNRDVFQPRQLMTVGEMSSTTLEHCQQYAAINGDQLSMVFNFHHLKVDYPAGEKWALAKPDFIELKSIFRHWQQGMHNHGWSALFWCNHDQPRIVSRFGDPGDLRVPSAGMLALVLHGMQGTPFIYQGEEIGMLNPDFTCIEQYRDVESLNMYAERKAAGQSDETLLAILRSKSRDNSRTPVQWDASPNAGFTQGIPWIACAPGYRDINVEQALKDPDSLFWLYQRLIKLRKQLPVLIHGNYQDLDPDDSALWCYQREWKKQRLLVIANLSRNSVYWQGVQEPGSSTWQPVISNYSDQPAHPVAGVLRPFETTWWLSDNY